MKKLKRLYFKTSLIWKFEKLFFTSMLSFYYDNASIFFSSILFVKSPSFGFKSLMFAIIRGAILLSPFYFSFRFREKEGELRKYSKEMIRRNSCKKEKTYLASFQREMYDRVRTRDHLLTSSLVVFRKAKNEDLKQIEKRLSKAIIIVIFSQNVREIRAQNTARKHQPSRLRDPVLAKFNHLRSGHSSQPPRASRVLAGLHHRRNASFLSRTRIPHSPSKSLYGRVYLGSFVRGFHIFLD